MVADFLIWMLGGWSIFIDFCLPVPQVVEVCALWVACRVGQQRACPTDVGSPRPIPVSRLHALQARWGVCRVTRGGLLGLAGAVLGPRALARLIWAGWDGLA